MIRESDVALLLVDPDLCDDNLIERVERSPYIIRSLPILVYASLAPASIARGWRFARTGAELILYGVHDEASTLRHIVTRMIDRAVEDKLISVIRHLLDRLPQPVSAAVVTTLYSPERARTGDDIARIAMMTRRSLYRHMATVNLHPRDVIECAQVLRAYLLLGDPTVLVKDVTTRLRFSDSRTLNSLIFKWTGVHPSALRNVMSQEQLIARLGSHLTGDVPVVHEPLPHIAEYSTTI